MVGLELHPDRVEGAIYTSVLRTERTTRAVRDAFGFLVRVVPAFAPPRRLPVC